MYRVSDHMICTGADRYLKVYQIFSFLEYTIGPHPGNKVYPTPAAGKDINMNNVHRVHIL